MLRYIELKTGFNGNGPAWIGHVQGSHSGRTMYFNGKAFRRTKRATSSANYYDVETFDEYWISGVKRSGNDRHWAGSGKVMIQASAVEEYLRVTGMTGLDRLRFVVATDIQPTDIARFHDIENQRYQPPRS